jgi:hypothetical protein
MGSNTARFSSVFVARTVLAALLMCAVLSVSVPLASVSANSICRLACCAGHATHTAGSCRHGSCQAAIVTLKRAHLHPETTPKSESLCGLSRHATLFFRRTTSLKTVVASSTSDSIPGKASRNGPQSSAAVLTKSCPPDCGGCVSSSTSSNRQRHIAPIAYATGPQPPPDCHRFEFARHGAQTLDALCRQCAPRGPPVRFS